MRNTFYLLIWLLVVIDAYLTYLLVSEPGLVEFNPAMSWAMSLPPGMWLLKVSGLLMIWWYLDHISLDVLRIVAILMTAVCTWNLALGSLVL